jgi:hypothetical protein
MAISVSSLPSAGDKALGSLLLTLSALGTRMDKNSSFGIPSAGNKIDNDGNLNDIPIAAKLQETLEHLINMINTPEPEESRWNEKE